MLHVTPHAEFPDELSLHFAGTTIAYRPCWAWCLMNVADLYASERGTLEDKGGKAYVDKHYAPTVGLGKGLRFLAERGWTGKLTVKSHCKAVESISDNDGLMAKVRELLAKFDYQGATKVEYASNAFCDQLVRMGYDEWCKADKEKAAKERNERKRIA